MSRFLRVSEFANMVGVTSVTVRDWEKRGWLLPNHKSASGYRYYTTKQVDDYLSGESFRKQALSKEK